jgi:glycosyltransferase involved in cell wall biosynthesis
MPLHVCQLCAVDFTLRHFLTALIDGMRRHGWNVTGVCSDGGFVPRLREQGYRVQTLPIARGLNPLRHTVTLVRLILLFRRERFDILHVHTPIAALLGRIAGRLSGIPMIIYTAHGFYFHDHMRPLPKAAFLLLERLGGGLTDLLFTQSAEDAATAIEKRFLPAHRVVAIGNGVDPAAFKPGDTVIRVKMRAALGIPADAVVIGMIGRMVLEKGYSEFFEAAIQIAKARADVVFVAIGDRLPSDHAGSVDRSLEAARSSLGRRLVLTGLRDDIADLLTALDIFTLPSYREGMPRTIIEAMMTALPVVATDIRGSREEVVHGETGLLVPPRDAPALANALQALVDSPQTRLRMGRAGRERALAHFDESRVVARQIDEILARLPGTLRAAQ